MIIQPNSITAVAPPGHSHGAAVSPSEATAGAETLVATPAAVESNSQGTCPSCQGSGCPTCQGKPESLAPQAAKELGARAVGLASQPESEEELAGPEQLDEEEQREVEELKARDREVRAHEAAHQAAAGGLAQGGASYSYTTGPDGRRYAVGGEVSIDTSEVSGDPAATLRKAQQIRQAALAPASPSGSDRAIAQKASAMATKARAEMAEQAREDLPAVDEPETPLQQPGLLGSYGAPDSAPVPGELLPQIYA